MNRYVSVTSGQTEQLNRLLIQGWRPVREIVVPGQDATVLTLLEKPDFPAGRVDFPELGTVAASRLAEFRLLDGLTDNEMSDIAACCDGRSFAAEESIFDAGEPGQTLYFVLTGQVSLQLVDLPLEDAEILSVGPGDAFGESTFFSPGPHSVKAVATTALEVLVLERERYDELLQSSNPAAGKLAINAAELLGTRLQETDLWMKQILEEDQNAEIAASWRRFRRGVGGGSESSGGFFHA